MAAETSFTDLRAANVARQTEWDPDNTISLVFRGNELGGECGEAQNVIKKLERERLGIRGTRASIEDLASELADVVMCADLIAMQAGIDLGQAIADKFNETSRKYGLQTRIPSRDHRIDDLIEKASRLGIPPGDQRASWVIGEMLLADPHLSVTAAEARFQQATGGR